MEECRPLPVARAAASAVHSECFVGLDSGMMIGRSFISPIIVCQECR